MDPLQLFAVLRILLLILLGFALAMAWTPILAAGLFRFGIKKRIRDGGQTPVFTALHAHKKDTPVMGGLLVWVTTLIITLLFWLSSWFFPDFFGPLNFLTRSETWLPLGAFVAAALVGVVDDLLNVHGIGTVGGGFTVRHRLTLYTMIALIGAWWFTFKLGWDFIHIPLYGDIVVGGWYFAIFALVIVATAFSVNEIDGLDGLAGGVLMLILSAYVIIAFAQHHYDLAALIAVIVGSLLAFLWFNILPARFIMGDTGSMSLGVVLGVVAMLTNTMFLLPIFGLLLVAESLSVIIQVLSKKIFKRKVFLSAPFHHHLEAIGWPEAKVVMRFWVITGVMTMVGLAVFLIDRILFSA